MGSGASKLQATIQDGAFYTISDAEVLKQVNACFSHELKRLQKAYTVEKCPSPQLRAIRETQKQTKTPSEFLFGKNYDEVNRTLTGVLVLRWICNDDYETFVSGQPSAVKLKRESFNDMRDFFRRNLQAPEDTFALVLSMVVNDLGKDPDLEEDFYLRTKPSTRMLDGQNHDAILFEAAKAGMVDCLNLLSPAYRADVMLGLELGSQLNAGQLAQAENLPINLECLLEMRGHDHAFHLKYMEQVLDVAGAAAHYDPRGARNLIEPVYQGFRTVYDVSMDIIKGRCNLRQGYDKILTKRGQLLVEAGFRELSVSIREERALLRLLTMGRTSTKEQADLFSAAFDALDPVNRDLLVEGLNVDGKENETAILPYYMPAMLSETLNNTESWTTSERQNALTALIRYLARVLRSTDANNLQNMPKDWFSQLKEQQRQMGWEYEPDKVPGIVIERNMIQARATISSAAFRTNPDMLDELEIPKGQVLQRRRTSHSVVEMESMVAQANPQK